jgi:hypothetical protein
MDDFCVNHKEQLGTHHMPSGRRLCDECFQQVPQRAPKSAPLAELVGLVPARPLEELLSDESAREPTPPLRMHDLPATRKRVTLALPDGPDLDGREYVSRHLDPGLKQRAVDGFLAGWSVNRVATEVGIAKLTAQRIRKDLGDQLPKFCACGGLNGHKGWCGPRVAKSPARQAVIAGFRDRPARVKSALRRGVLPAKKETPANGATPTTGKMMFMNTDYTAVYHDMLNQRRLLDEAIAALEHLCAHGRQP